MVITAKFAGRCGCCGQSIAAGSKIEWSKGAPAKHAACASGPATAAATVSDRRSFRRSDSRGRWTGCSCGSRVDSSGQLVNRDRACAQCQFDD
jgi:hypothetical protein